MEIRKIYVIIDLNKYSKDDVVKDIKEEGYKHDFYFGNVDKNSFSASCLEEADEVWCFGNCEGINDYLMAKMLGKDIWVMK